MLFNIRTILKQCEVCEQYAISKPPTKSVIPISIDTPLHTWVLDVVGPMPTRGEEPKRFIITAIDYASRWPVAQAVRYHKGAMIRRFIANQIIKPFDAKLIFMDGGLEMVSDAMETYLANKEIKHIVTTPYHPQANGRIEQLNGSLLEILKKLSVGTLRLG